MPSDGVLMGPVVRSGPFVVREIRYAPGVRQDCHTHAYMGVTMVVSGSIREQAGSCEEFGGALSVVVKPAGVEHADEVGPRGACTLQIAFDPAATGALLDAENSLDSWRWLHGGAPAAPMLRLLRLTRRAGDGPGDAFSESVVDALGALMIDRPVSGTAPAWLRRVKEALDDDMSAQVRDLARDAGVHEVSLSRAFRRHYGCTISEYRRRERIRRAAQSIDASAEQLSRIACAAGFADQAHLCREFRRTTGLPASEFRRLTREAPLTGPGQQG